MLLPQLLKHEILVMVMVMVMIITVPDNISGHTTCTAITTVYNTSVTCLFGEDISKLSFNVQFFFPNTSVDPELTLLYNKLMSGELTCHKGSQVLFDEKKEIVDRFTFSRPPSLTKLSGGYYQCHAVPSLREKIHFCPLTYKDVLNFVPWESPHPQPPPSKVGSDVILTFTMVAIVTILILFIIVMIIAGIYLWKKRKRTTAQRRKHEDVEDVRGNDESIEMVASSSESQRRKELPSDTLHDYDKYQDEDEGSESDDTMEVHRPNPQSLQLASQSTHPGPTTLCSPQYPATSPVRAVAYSREHIFHDRTKSYVAHNLQKLPTDPLLDYDKYQDEDEGSEWDDTMEEHHFNSQSLQPAWQSTHTGSTTSCSPLNPATSPVQPETQPSQTGSVKKTSMPPSCDIEDMNPVEDDNLTVEEHEAGPNMGDHGVGDEIKMDKKAKRDKLKAYKKAKKKKLEAEEKAKKEELKADKKAKNEKVKADKKAKKEKVKAEKKANKEKVKADKKAKTEKKRSGRKAKKDKNRDRRGSQREENVMDPQESSNEHETVV